MAVQLCNLLDCNRRAAVALRTTRPSRVSIITRIWWGPEEAPSTADLYCLSCALKTLQQLGEVLTLAEDDE